MGKIFDCFPFIDELEMLDLRFKLHDPFVDYFVLIESTKTFTGKLKSLTFKENSNLFERFRPKIIHVVVDEFPETNDPFEREYFQRHQLLEIARRAEDDDTFIIADADELLRGDAISAASAFEGVTIFDMPMFQFYMNRQQAPSGWSACYAAKKRFLLNIEHVAKARWVRDGYLSTLHANNQIQTFRDAGWHFTHLGGVERLQTKFQAYSHSEDPWPRAMRSDEALRSHIIAGGIVGNFKETTKMVQVSYPYYPREINDNQSIFIAKGMIKDVFEALDELQQLHRNYRNAFALLARDSPDAQPLLSGLSARDFSKLADLSL